MRRSTTTSRADASRRRTSSPTRSSTTTRARRRSARGRPSGRREDRGRKKPHSVPFLYNLWERDERFWEIDANPIIAGMARQLLGSEEVVLMEDGAVVKKPVVGRQARLAPGLRLLAARDPGRGDVLDRSRRRRGRERRHAGRGRLAQAGREAPGRVRRRQLVHARRAARYRRAGAARGGGPRGCRVRAQGRRVRLPPRAAVARVRPEHEPEPPARVRSPLRGRGNDVAGSPAVSLQLHRRGARVRSRASRSTARISRGSRPRSENSVAARPSPGGAATLPPGVAALTSGPELRARPCAASSRCRS